jgi:hypothetical protein
MTLPYAARVLAVCLASFFAINLALSALVRVFVPFSLDRAERMRARSAANLVLGLRLFPSLLAAALVVALCLPSFISFENERGAEQVGIPFLIAAALGASVWIVSLARGVRAVVSARRFIERCSMQLPVHPNSVWVLESGTPLVGLAGLLKPRVIVSRCVAQALNADQLAAALHHENAHRDSSDNLKRLLLLVAPDVFPGLNLLRSFDRAWVHFSEWAADDCVVGNDPRLSLPLAEALVRVARLGSAHQPSALMSAFVLPNDNISQRVGRLLDGSSVSALTSPRIIGPKTAVFLSVSLLAASNIPGVLSGVHELLERFIH